MFVRCGSQSFGCVNVDDAQTMSQHMSISSMSSLNSRTSLTSMNSTSEFRPGTVYEDVERPPTPHAGVKFRTQEFETSMLDQLYELLQRCVDPIDVLCAAMKKEEASREVADAALVEMFSKVEPLQILNENICEKGNLIFCIKAGYETRQTFQPALIRNFFDYPIKDIAICKI